MHFPLHSFPELSASDTVVISHPCHVSLRINYEAGAVESIILHLRSAVYAYYSPVIGKQNKQNPPGLIKDEKML